MSVDAMNEMKTISGKELIATPTLNKGTAFTFEERSRFSLHGLLPSRVETLDEQVDRAYEAFQRKADDLEKHIYLRQLQLQDTNEVLFYQLLLNHITEMLPIVYTPTVAQGCQLFSKIYRRPRGLFISYPPRDQIPAILRNRPNKDVDVIVVTDGERILGIGDQGVGGLGIPIGKLSLYSLIGGIDPARTLPIVLDCGTNNPELLADPEYLGWRHERISGKDYYDFVDQFVQAVKQEMPNTCLQWEDFASTHARPILEWYRDQLLTFNDDIQGTAAVALGAVLSALRVSGGELKDQKFVFLGAGSAAIGVADYLRRAVVDAGVSDEEARRQFWIVDKDGLLHSERTDLSPGQKVYAQDANAVVHWPKTFNGNIGLADVIGQIEATVLIGFSTVGGAFTEPIVRKMASKVKRPIIFPLSNPTSRSEAQPEDLIRWTSGRALVATGSPFSPVQYGNLEIAIAQCNNVYIFPAVGLGIVASGATRVTDGMLLAAAYALAENSSALQVASAPLLPHLTDIRTVAAEMACTPNDTRRTSGTPAADPVGPGLFAHQLSGNGSRGGAAMTKASKTALSYAARPHVVIIGGGFGGLAAARALRNAPVRITLIDRSNHHLFQPLLYQVATAVLPPGNIAAPIRNLLKEQENVTVVLGKVIDIESREQRVSVVLADGAQHVIEYDYLVVATGAQHSYFGRDEFAEHAPGLKTLSDALTIRQKVLYAFAQAEASEDPASDDLLTFVLVGAGPTGVELAGALANLTRKTMMSSFRRFDPASARIILIDQANRILGAFAEEISLKAQRYLEELGVEVRLGHGIEQIDEHGVVVGGERIASKTVIWTAGVAASPVGKWLRTETDRAGRVSIQQNLTVAGHTNVFVVGDTGSLDQDGRPLAGVAQVAMQQGDYAGRLIGRRTTGKPDLSPFRYFDKGNMAVVGGRYAILQCGKIRLTGLPAWLPWAAIHLAYLPLLNLRGAVFLQWVWTYLTGIRGSLLISHKLNHGSRAEAAKCLEESA